MGIKGVNSHKEGVFAGVMVVARALADELKAVFVIEGLGGGVVLTDFEGGEGGGMGVGEVEHVEEEKFAKLAAAPRGIDSDGADMLFSGDKPVAGVANEGVVVGEGLIGGEVVVG